MKVVYSRLPIYPFASGHNLCGLHLQNFKEKTCEEYLNGNA